MFKNILFKNHIPKWVSICLICGLLSGCSLPIQPTPTTEGETESTDEPIVEVQPSPGGEIVFATRKPSTLNPIVSDDASMKSLFQLVFDPLISYDNNHQPIPHLAESWSFEQGGLSLTFNLRGDVMWHDGKPFTAKDVIFTLDEIKKSSSSPYKRAIENIASTI